MYRRVNDDGRLWPRIVAAAIPAGVSLVISLAAFVILFWSESKTVDAKTADAIGRLERRIDVVEAEARKVREEAAADRQKIAELLADVRNISHSTARIEALLDKTMMGTPSHVP